MPKITSFISTRQIALSIHLLLALAGLPAWAQQSCDINFNASLIKELVDLRVKMQANLGSPVYSKLNSEFNRKATSLAESMGRENFDSALRNAMKGSNSPKVETKAQELTEIKKQERRKVELETLYNLPWELPSRPTRVEWALDGRKLIVGLPDSKPKITIIRDFGTPEINPEDRSLKGSLTHVESSKSRFFTHDGTTTYMYDLVSEKLIREFPGNLQVTQMNDVLIFNDGQRVHIYPASGIGDGFSAAAHANDIHTTTDRKWLLQQGPFQTKVDDLHNKVPVDVSDLGKPLSLTKDGLLLVESTDKTKIIFVDLNAAKTQVAKIEKHHSHFLTESTKYLVERESTFGAGGNNYSIYNLKDLSTPPTTLKVHDIRPLPIGDLVIVQTQNSGPSRTQILDLSTGKIVIDVESSQVDFSDYDNNQIAFKRSYSDSESTSSIVEIFSLTDFKKKSELMIELGTTHPAAKGKYLTVSTMDEMIIYSTQTGYEVMRFELDIDKRNSVRFSDKGDYFSIVPDFTKTLKITKITETQQ
jgi:hypothetical protein